MNIFSIASFLAFSICLFLGILVYIKGKGKKQNNIFSIGAIFLGIWVLFPFTAAIVRNETSALFCTRIIYAFAAFVPSIWLHFVLGLMERKKRILLISIYSISFLFSVFSFHPLFIKGVVRFAPHFSVIPNPLYSFFVLYFTITVWIILYYLLDSYKKVTGYKRSQIKYISVAVIFGISGAAMHFLSGYFNKAPFPHDFLVIISPCIMAFAILRYHLLDITIAIKKTTLIAMAVILPAAGLYVGVSFLQPKLFGLMGRNWWLVPAAITVVLTLGLFRLLDYIVRLKDEELVKDRYLYRTRLRKVSERLAQAKSLRELATYIVRYVSEIARLDFCAVVLRKEEQRICDEVIRKIPYYQIVRIANRTGKILNPSLKGLRIESDSILVKYLINNRKPLEKGYFKHLLNSHHLKEERGVLTELIHRMDELNCELLVPSLCVDTLVGMLLLGRKLDESMYSREDLDLFSLLSSEAARPIGEIIQREDNVKLILASTNSALNALQERDQYTRGHTERVRRFCLQLAKSEALKPLVAKIPDGIWGLEITAQLHDLGKIGIPDHILNKPGKLDQEEWEWIKKHPQKALVIIGELSLWLKGDIISGILQHQEHYDGTGYPKRLSKSEIHIYARIIHVADALDAMTSKRPYRAALSLEAAIEEIKRNSGSQFDPIVAKAAEKLYQTGKLSLLLEEIKDSGIKNDNKDIG